MIPMTLTIKKATPGPVSPHAPESSHIWGFDAVRLIAMAGVATLHVHAVSGRDSRLMPYYYLGVPVFAAVSGYLALRSEGPSLGWFGRRVKRIYVPYWISLTAILAANALVRYKPTSPGLVVAQYLGVALFTHPRELIGVHTWFVSAILVCYVMAMLIRWDRTLFPLAIAASVGLQLSGVFGPWDCILAFLAGGVIARAPRQRVGALWVAAASLAALFGGQEVYLNVLAGAVALWAGSFCSGGRPRVVSSLSRVSYEFFLVHGIVYLSLARLGHLGFWWNALAGTPAAFLAAVLLHRASEAVYSASDAISGRARSYRESRLTARATPVSVESGETRGEA